MMLHTGWPFHDEEADLLGHYFLGDRDLGGGYPITYSNGNGSGRAYSDGTGCGAGLTHTFHSSWYTSDIKTQEIK